jgi:hypothetical protein
MNFIIKTLKLTLVILLAFSTNIFAQNQDLQVLSRQVSDFYQQGNFDKAIPPAEKIVEIQRQNKANSARGLINALENLSQIKLGRFKQSRQAPTGDNLDKERAEKLIGLVEKDAKDIETLVREALTLSDKEAKKDYVQTISLKNELAWIIYNYFPTGQALKFGVSKEEHDKFESISKINYHARIDEAETLYSEALKEGEKNFGEENDIALVTAYNFAEFSLATSNFEKAMALYEKCLGVIEKKYGAESVSLILPLQNYAKILTAAGQNKAAAEAAGRLQKLTDKPADFSKVLLNLSPRADKSFAVTNVPWIENQAERNEAVIALAQRSATVGGGSANSDNYNRILSGSTSGKSYYDNYREMKLITIPVRVLVDEKGKVVEMEALTKNKDLKTTAEKVVKDWTFRPFILNGQAQKISGYVDCLFFSN